MYELTYLKTDSREVNTAYYTAISDVVANIQPMHSSFCGGEIPVLDIVKNTLLSVLEQRDGRTYIGGEY